MTHSFHLIQFHLKGLLTGYCLTILSSLAFSQTFQHAKRMGCDKAEDRGAAITVDRQGNQYTTGYFRSFTGIGAQAADFDPGPAFYPMWSNQGGYDVFVSKLDAQGNFVWAKQFPGGGGFGKAIITDSSGNVYVTGRFAGTADFDPGPGVLYMTSNQGSYDVFIVKLNPNGNFVWARSLGSNGEEDSNGLVVDHEGNILISGFFSGIGDFDPGPNVLNLSSLGQFNTFLVKLTAGGNLVWARNMGGYASDNAGLAVDSFGNCFFTGCFYLSSDVNPDSLAEFTLTARGAFDLFITKLNSSGTFVWSKGFGTTDYDFPSGLKLDKAGNIYACGSFNGDTLKDVQTGLPIVVNSKKGRNDAFIIKINSMGNFIWGYTIGDTSDNDGMSLALASDESVYFAGTFRDSVDFDPGPGKHYIKSKGDPDAFILKLDSAGAFQRVLPVLGKRYVFPASLFIDGLQNLYATGWYSSYFSEAIDFDPGPGESGLSGFNNDDIFTLKLSTCQRTADSLWTSSCQNYMWNEVTYTQSGTYTQNLSTPNGCDSTLVIKLTITQPSQSNPTYQLCPGQTVQVGSTIYNTPGIYTDTLIASNGCDSIVTSTISYSIPNNSIQQTGPQLEAAAGQDSYQWLDCNAEYSTITGATEPTFSPTLSGSYSVRVTKGNCADTSDCVVFTSEKGTLTKRTHVYPQPVRDKLYLKTNTKEPITSIELTDMLGRIVLSEKGETISVVSVLPIPPGIYQLKILAGSSVDVVPVLIR